MSILIDHTKLNLGTEVVIDTTSTPHTIQLVVTGNLTADGVTIDCVYSACKVFWRTDATLPKFKFPLVPLGFEQFEIGADVAWDWKDDTTRYLLKTGGWAVKDPSGVSKEEWAGIISLGSIGALDQPYFLQTGSTAVNFQNTGPVNQAVKVYGDLTHGNFDYRTAFKLFVREQAKLYATASLTDIGVTTLSYQAYRFPLADAVDIKVTDSDVTVTGFGITATWYVAAQSRTIGGSAYNFHVIINGNSKTAEQIYEGVQLMLRSAADIDAGAGIKIGKVTNSLLTFVGSDLYTLLDSTGGVFIDNYLTVDVNRLHFTDDTNVSRTFPFVAALTIQFGSNLVNDAAANFKCYFTTNPAGNFGTANAVLVQDATPANISGTVSGNSSLTFTFAYDANIQGGRTAGTDAAITVVAIGLATAQYVLATGTISRNTNNTVSLAAPLERNYA